MQKMVPLIYRDILEHIADGVYMADAAGALVYANAALCGRLGRPREELKGKSIDDLFARGAPGQAEERLARLREGEPVRFDGTCMGGQGSTIIMDISSVPVFDEAGGYRGTYAVLRDITERRACETALLEEKGFLGDLVSLCPDSIIAVDRGGTIILFNRAAERLTGHPIEAAVGKMPISDIYGGTAPARAIKKKLHGPDFGGPGQLDGYETRIKDRRGDTIPIRLSATLLYKDDREVGSVGFFHDLTRRRQLEDRLRELSVTDGLSGLYNQRHFHKVLTEEMGRFARYGRPLSLICFDIDKFKQCNDTLGHLEGDNVIRLVGAILKEVMRKSDFCFRYGGDEFMILLPETELAQARFSAEKVRKTFNERWSIHTVYGRSALERISLSLGVAEALPGEEKSIFLKRSDLAMYEAKRSGGDRTVTAGSWIGGGGA